MIIFLSNKRKLTVIFIILFVVLPISSNAKIVHEKIFSPISRVFWGSSNVNFPANEYFYIGAGGAILISNIVSKDSIDIINYFYLPTIVQDIYVESDILYALDLKNGLLIYNVSNVLEPILISSLNFEKECYDFVVEPNNVYITHGVDGITKIDISDISTPHFLLKSTISSHSISQYQSYLYSIAEAYSPDSVRIINSANLEQVGGIPIGLSYPISSVERLKFNGYKGFLVENYYGILNKQTENVQNAWSDLTILDMSNPLNPSKRKRITLHDNVQAFTNSNDTLFMGLSDELLVIDASNIDNPSVVTSVPHIFPNNYSLAYFSYQFPYLFGSYDYMAGLKIIELSDVMNIQEGLFLDTSSKIGSLCANDSALIAGRYEGNGLYLVDISNISKPVVKQIYKKNTGYVRGLKIKNDIIFASTENGLKIFQINGLDSINLISEIDYGVISWRVDANDYIVAIGGYYEDVHLINISDLFAPNYITKIEMPTSMVIEDIYVRDNFLFICGDYGGPYIYDISDPDNPLELWDGDAISGESMFPLEDANALFLGDNNQLTVLNIENIGNPVEITRFSVSNRIIDIFAKNNYLFLSSFDQYQYESCLHIYDITNLNNIIQVGTAKTPNWAYNIFVNDNFLFLSDFEDGVYIFDLDDIITKISFEVDEILSTHSFNLFQNYPNPFNASTTIRFSLPQSEMVELNIYNVLGQLVRNLVNEEKPAGKYSIIWDGTNEKCELLSNGIYIYTIKTGNNISISNKLLILK